MKFKGTRGKWLVGDAEMKDTGVNELVIYPENIEKYHGGYRVICCVSPMKRIDDEDLANARIMAKAPEMLKMLNIVLNDYKNIIPSSPARDTRISQIQELIKSATEL